MKLIIATASLSFVMLQMTASQGLPGQTHPPKSRQTREIVSTPGVDLISQLRPDDSIVTVVRGGISSGPSLAPAEPPQTADEELERIGRESDGIANVTIKNVEGFFVDNGAWIRTRVSGTAQYIVKGDQPVVDWLNAFTFEQDGGEIRVKSTVLKTSDEYRKYRAGEKYLLFVRRDAMGTPKPFGPQFRIVNGRLAPIELSTGLPPKPDSPLWGMDANEIIERLSRRP